MRPNRVSYSGFLSYSRKDRAQAVRLVRALEDFSLPSSVKRRLKARNAEFTAPRPIFRDEEDMPVGGVMSERLRSVLDASASLIVLCTPTSAKSDWVDQEIRYFQEHHPDRPLVPVIGAGDPDTRGCFPAALTARGRPLAADLRDPREFRTNVPKIAAAMLRLDMEEMVRRIQRRRLMRVAIASGVIGAALASVAVLGAVTLQQAARAGQADELARGTIERLLNESRVEADKVGQLAAKRMLHNVAAEYFDGKPARRMTDEDWLLKAEWLRQRGSDEFSAGRFDQAQELRLEASRIAASLVADRPNNGAAHFSLGQSVGDIAEGYYQRGDIEATKKYQDMALEAFRNAVRLEPLHVQAKLQFAYAQINLGNLDLNEYRNPEIAAERFGGAISEIEDLATDATARTNLSATFALRVSALAQYSTADAVLKEIDHWEKVLAALELDAREGGPIGDSRINEILVRDWIVVSRLKERAGRIDAAKEASKKVLGFAARLKEDTENQSRLKLAESVPGQPTQCAASEIRFEHTNLDADAVGEWSVCFRTASARQRKTSCESFLTVLENVPPNLSLESYWAQMVVACAKQAYLTKDPELSALAQAAGKSRFFGRPRKNFTLWTQLEFRDSARYFGDSVWVEQLKSELSFSGWQ
jgi:tetratricopeptide (TPR) repeat protein